MSLWRWLGLDDRSPEPGQAHGLREIEARLEALPAERARYVARFAYLLARAARADHDVTEPERRTMEQILVERASLPSDQAALAVSLVTSHGLRFGGTDDFLVTREFAAIATEAEKLALLDCLYAVAAADESIRTLEDNEIRRIAAELRLPYEEIARVAEPHAKHLAARTSGGSGSAA